MQVTNRPARSETTVFYNVCHTDQWDRGRGDCPRGGTPAGGKAGDILEAITPSNNFPLPLLDIETPVSIG